MHIVRWLHIGTYTIALEKVVTLAARLAPPKPVVESLRIQALRTSVERGERDSVSSFWEEVKTAGAPLIEPIVDDRENMAVTLVWKGTPHTHNVLVLWLPYVGVAPDEFLMTRLAEIDVWYKTIKVDRKMRLAYTLAPNAARLHPLSLGFDADAITMTAAAARPDPLNPKLYLVASESVDATEYRGNSVLEMPDAPPQPWIAQRPGVPAGRVDGHRFKSAATKQRTGDRRLSATPLFTACGAVSPARPIRRRRLYWRNWKDTSGSHPHDAR